VLAECSKVVTQFPVSRLLRYVFRAVVCRASLGAEGQNACVSGNFASFFGREVTYARVNTLVAFARVRGFTLIELVVATSILLILSGMAIPVARVMVKREKERQLRTALWEMRDAIDRYKDAGDRGSFQIKVGSYGYPPDLETLVNGVDIGAKKVRFLRRVPVDPMTGTTDWGLHGVQDDPDSDSWNGENVFDVYTKSSETALDGTNYRDW